MTQSIKATKASNYSRHLFAQLSIFEKGHSTTGIQALFYFIFESNTSHSCTVQKFRGKFKDNTQTCKMSSLIEELNAIKFRNILIIILRTEQELRQSLSIVIETAPEKLRGRVNVSHSTSCIFIIRYKICFWVRKLFSKQKIDRLQRI